MTQLDQPHWLSWELQCLKHLLGSPGEARSCCKHWEEEKADLQEEEKEAGTESGDLETESDLD